MNFLSLRDLGSPRFLVLAGCLSLTLAGSSVADLRKPDSLVKGLSTIGQEITGWRTTDEQSVPAGILQKLLPTSYLSRVYEKDGRQLGLFIAYYAQQRAGESMHSPKACLPGNGWQIVRQGSAAIWVGGARIDVNQYHIDNAGEQMLALYWYQSRHRIIANEYMGKLALIKDAVFSGYTSGSIVRIIVSDDAWSSTQAAAFAAALIPQVRRCFGD